MLFYNPNEIVNHYSKSLPRWQHAQRMMNNLHISGLITDTEYDKIIKRIQKWIQEYQETEK